VGKEGEVKINSELLALAKRLKERIGTAPALYDEEQNPAAYAAMNRTEGFAEEIDIHAVLDGTLRPTRPVFLLLSKEVDEDGFREALLFEISEWASEQMRIADRFGELAKHRVQ
jgi:hypothetical protein